MDADTHVCSKPTISYVIIGRNEAQSIGKCIESVLQSSHRFDSSEIVFVDSRSTDSTVEIAKRYPIAVLRLLENQTASPAAGRTIGTQFTKGEFVMYVDGDMTLNPEWTANAVSFMKLHEDFGAIFGRLVSSPEALRRHEHGSVQTYVSRKTKEGLSVSNAKRVSGAVLMRRSSLDRVGGFNPHLTGDEEAELSYRISSHGLKIGASHEVMAIHPSRRNSTLKETWRRFKNGYFKGQGKVLVTSYRQGWAAFKHHLWRLKRFLIYFLWLISGIFWLLLSIIAEHHLSFLIWLGITAIGITAMAIKHGLHDTPRRLLSSILVGFGFLQAVLQKTPFPEDFPEGFERVK